MELGVPEAREADAPLQSLYAHALERLGRLAVAGAALALVLLFAGWPAPSLSPEGVAALWHLPSEAYLARSGLPAGWPAFLPQAAADRLAFLAIAGFALVVVFAHAVLLRAALVRREGLLAGVVAAQLLVLALSVSGVLAGG